MRGDSPISLDKARLSPVTQSRICTSHCDSPHWYPAAPPVALHRTPTAWNPNRRSR